MIERELGKDMPQGEVRKKFLEDNCDAVEKKGYMKPFTPEELTEMKDELAEVAIEINDIETAKKEAMKAFNHELEPHKEEKKTLLSSLKNKAEFIEEECYKFVDKEARTVGYYNSNGDLIESRAAYATELQGTIFQINRTGTNN